MVFVFMLFTITFFTLLIITILKNIGNSVTILDFSIKFRDVLSFLLNSLLIITGLIIINFNFISFFCFILFVSFLQVFVWQITLNFLFTNLTVVYREFILTYLFSNNIFLYYLTFFRNKYKLIGIHMYEVGQEFLDIIYDVKFFLLNLNREVVRDLILEYLLVLKESILTYIEIINIKDCLDNSSDSKIINLQQRLKDLRNPRIMFNLVRRLPIYFTYDYISFNKNSIFKHILVIYNFLKSTLLALLASSLYFFYTIFFFKIQFLKQLAIWFVIGLMFFWLISGFNFFLKRYQFGKFTSQIQRFWKRTNSYFWLIEGFLLLLFFYYYLNSSQEPVYMYDYSSLNQEYLISLHIISLNIILLSLIIYFMYFILFRINSNSWEQLSLYLIVVSVFVFFSFFIETYQFYYVISVFNEKLWVFNEEENLWSIETDNPILRTKIQYFLVCLIAKYWHFLFIFLSWVFFLIKSFEKKKSL